MIDREARSGLLGGVLAATVMITSALSYAALVFSGGLSGGLRVGVTDALIATAIISAALAAFGSLRFEIGAPPGNGVAVVAIIAAALNHTVSNEAPAIVIATVLVGIALSTIATGLFLLCLGVLRAGRWMRFIPYPVIGGVLGAAGWLIVIGSVRVIGTASGVQLAVGLAFAALLVAANMRIRNPLVLPSLLLVGTVAFYAVISVMGMPVSAARSEGWLFDVPHGSAFALPWNSSTLHGVVWPALGQRLADGLALLVVMALSVLFNTSGIELMTHSDADLDHELRVQGFANLASGLLGGFVCVGLPNVTMLSYRTAGKSRIPPIVVAVSSIGMLLGGSAIVEAIPRFVFGALIFTTGFGFLYEWCVRTARRLPLYDYLSILAIIAVVMRFGYIAGVAAGILIGCIIFVVSYSRVRVIKHSLSGAEFRSGVIRSLEEREILKNHGGAVRILVLQGFIFFGMADRVQRAVRAIIDRNEPLPEFIVLDFRAVNGLDSSAASSFVKIRQIAQRAGVTLIFSRMSTQVERQWQLSNGKETHGVLPFREIEEALEFCEDKILSVRTERRVDEGTIFEWMSRELRDEGLAKRLLTYLEVRRLEQGDVLCEQGAAADAMYFVEQGRIAVSVRSDSGNVRLRTLGDCTILGEMGLYRQGMRSASLTADKSSMVYVLSRANFEAMERDDSSLAAAFHAAIVRTLADRLEFESAMAASLQR